MKILHTGDWHIGRTLYGKKRYHEFERFLAWLVDTVRTEEIDVLLVAGDIFDTSTPSNRAQELYYRFLCRVAESSCRHLVVIGGNHDSPSFLDAPRELLKALDVHVVGQALDPPDQEVLVLRDHRNTPELIVCAVPYLRDRDIRVAEAGESITDKERKLIQGIGDHYTTVAAAADRERRELGADAPIVAMGHLFTAGGRTIDGDGVRELYVGSLAHVDASVFPGLFAYVALGHLHVPQTVNAPGTVRYCGSPLPMGFGEAKQQKAVYLIQFSGTDGAPVVHPIKIPVFQQLERISGDWNEISTRLAELTAIQSTAWLEIVHEGTEAIGNLRERVESALSDTAMDVLRIKDTRSPHHALTGTGTEETLDDLNEEDVFWRCLATRGIPEDQHPELYRTYQEAITALHDGDPRAE